MIYLFKKLKSFFEKKKDNQVKKPISDYSWLANKVLSEANKFIIDNNKMPSKLFIIEGLIPSKFLTEIVGYKINYRKYRRGGKSIFFE